MVGSLLTPSVGPIGYDNNNKNMSRPRPTNIFDCSLNLYLIRDKVSTMPLLMLLA